MISKFRKRYGEEYARYSDNVNITVRITQKEEGEEEWNAYPILSLPFPNFSSAERNSASHILDAK